MAFARAAEATAEHPAVRAWRRARADARSPRSVAPLIPPEGSRAHLAVFRLSGAAPDGGPVIAKMERAATIALEERIYTQILPTLGIEALRCHASLIDGDEGWLFLSEATGVPLVEDDPAHGSIAARWFADLHTSSSEQPSLAEALPRQDASRYRAHLERAVRRIVGATSNPALSDADATLLAAVVRRLERVRADWPQIEAAAAAFAPCLVHGDLSAKNAFVEASSGRFWMLDWQTAGWGCPAVDAFRLDPDAYRRARGDLPAADARDLARIGTIWRAIAAMDWGAGMLATPWVEHTMANFAGYLNSLERACDGEPYRIGSLEL